MHIHASHALLAVALVVWPLSVPTGTAVEIPPSKGPAFRLAASWPRAGDEEVRTDPVVLRFNLPVDPESVTGISVQVRQGTFVVPGTATTGLDARGRKDPRIVLWRPESPLPPSTYWEMTVARDVRSARGREMADPVSIPFTTGATKVEDVFSELPPRQHLSRVPALGPVPKVRFTFPSAGLGNVYSDEVVVRFSQPMDSGALEDGTFSVLLDGHPLPGAISFPTDWSGREVVFTPTHPLFKDTTFQMVVTRNARTLRGRYLREDFKAGFGTSPFKGGVKPLLETDFDDTSSPPIPVGRAFHTATVLPDGDILIVGGQDLGGTPLASCYRWKSAGGSFLPVGSLATARRKHAAVATREGGVMVTGGFGPSGTTLSSVEVFDAGTNTWSAAAPISPGRASHTATVVAGAKILVVGGFTTDAGSLTYATGAQVFDPFAKTWSATTGAPLGLRGGHSATLLNDGRVFLAGGNQGQVLGDELYNPVSGTFASSVLPLEYRAFHAACLTKTGNVLLAGGGPARAEQYDPLGNARKDAGSCPAFGLPVSTSPSYATLTPISGGGRVVLIGGLVPGGAGPGGDLVLAQVQIWDPGGGTGDGSFIPMNFDLGIPRAAHTVSPMPDGGFLIIGGFGVDGVSNVGAVTVFRPSP